MMCVGAEATSPFHCVWRLSAASLFRLEFRFGGSVVRWFGGPVVRWSGGPVVRWSGGPVRRFGSVFRARCFGSPFSVRRFRFAVWVRCCRFAVGVRRLSSRLGSVLPPRTRGIRRRSSADGDRVNCSSYAERMLGSSAQGTKGHDRNRCATAAGARRWDRSLAEGRSTTEVSETLAFAPVWRTAERPAS